MARSKHEEFQAVCGCILVSVCAFNYSLLPILYDRIWEEISVKSIGFGRSKGQTCRSKEDINFDLPDIMPQKKKTRISSCWISKIKTIANLVRVFLQGDLLEDLREQVRLLRRLPEKADVPFLLFQVLTLARNVCRSWCKPCSFSLRCKKAAPAIIFIDKLMPLIRQHGEALVEMMNINKPWTNSWLEMRIVLRNEGIIVIAATTFRCSRSAPPSGQFYEMKSLS